MSLTEYLEREFRRYYPDCKFLIQSSRSIISVHVEHPHGAVDYLQFQGDTNIDAWYTFANDDLSLVITIPLMKGTA